MTSAVPQPGALIGGVYRVLGPLGEGAMGVVLRARDETLDREVAIKFIHSELLDEGFRARFMAEARAMARVSHPNTLQIYAFGEHEGAPYFVMEYVDGVTLTEWLALQEDGVDIERAVELLGQVCEGVAAIHAARTVHRDLKPSNILIDSTGRPHVADLGVAILLRDGADAHEVVGTPTYMAPEVAFPDEASGGLGERADVYSLACTAYEVLTGRPPFTPEGHQALMFHHALVAPAPPSAFRPELSARMDAALLHALAKKPADRTPTVQAFHAALLAARESVSEPSRILVAEDNEDFREILDVALRMAFPDATLECVGDGRAALEAFDRTRPSVVILDLLMPELDGMELTRLLRTRDPEAHIPILVLTASGGPAEWKRLSAMGADRLLVKPVVLDDVVTLLRHSLKERGRARRSQAPAVVV